MKATKKDVLYALQFGHEKLIKTIVPGGGKNPDEYSLSGTGIQVDRKIARDLLTDPHVVAQEDGLFPGMSQSFAWKDEAA